MRVATQAKDSSLSELLKAGRHKQLPNVRSGRYSPDSLPSSSQPEESEGCSVTSSNEADIPATTSHPGLVTSYFTRMTPARQAQIDLRLLRLIVCGDLAFNILDNSFFWDCGIARSKIQCAGPVELDDNDDNSGSSGRRQQAAEMAL